MWCLAHALRVPLYTLVSALVGAASRVACRQRGSLTGRWHQVASTLTTVLNALLFAFVQESLRVATFSILRLHWFSSPIHNHHHYPPPHANSHTHTPSHDASFRLAWALALGWAAAEACAGVAQGYDQLELYADADPSEFLPSSTSFSALGSRRASTTSRASVPATYADDDDAFVDESGRGFGIGIGEGGAGGGGRREARGQALNLVRRSVWMAEEGEGVEGGSGKMRQGIPLRETEGEVLFDPDDVDDALERLANLKAREDLEEVYGEPYIVRIFFQCFFSMLDTEGAYLCVCAYTDHPGIRPPPPTT